MKQKQPGFGTVPLILSIVIVGLIGGVGYYLWSSNQTFSKQYSQSTTDDSVNTQAETQPQNACDDSFKYFKDEEIGVSFCYPESWSLEKRDSHRSNVVGNILLVSPDHSESKEGYGGTITGSVVSVLVYLNEDSRIRIRDILDGTEESPVIYSDVKAVKIAGKDGVSYLSVYEGPGGLTNEFEHSGITYKITLGQDIDGTGFNDNEDLYQKIVDSFQLLAE